MKLRNDVILRAEFDGNGILFDYRTGNNYFLNQTGVIICSCLENENGTTVETILAAIKDKTRGSNVQLESEVHAFLESLLKKELIFS